MPEHDALVRTYSHLRDFPQASDALQILRRVASLVKPLMRARGWKVRELSEFYPDNSNLLGLNYNKGQRILLRLRYRSDPTLFLPTEQIADTMLHELAHIVRGPHDAIFHALWNQLRDEHMALAIKGYTGENFLSDGHRLSSAPPPQSSSPMGEARRLAQAAAERRQRASERPLSRSSSRGHRLGGDVTARPPKNANDMRRVVAEAVARRNRHTSQALTGCATDGPQYSDQTRAVLVEQASRNGFRTQAEEDAANDAAISQAMWELVQEDEKRRLGDRYVPPTAEHPEGGGGWLTAGGEGLSPIVIDSDSDDYGDGDNEVAAPHPPPSRRPVSIPRKPPPPPPPPPRRSLHSSRPKPNSVSRPPSQPAPSSSGSRSSGSRSWACAVCTLQNPSTFLCCDACGTERRVVESTAKGNERSTHREAPPIPYSTHPSNTSLSLSSRQSSRQPSRQPSPPPPRSMKRSTEQTGIASAMAQHSHTRQQRPKKKVTFTPSTYGGSVTSATSTSARARPPTPPDGARAPTRRPTPAPAPAPAPAPSSSASASAKSETWMCTNCWAHTSQHMAQCAQCHKPCEPWQRR